MFLQNFSFPSFTSSTWIMKECFFSWMNLWIFELQCSTEKNFKLEKQFEQFDSIVWTFESIGSRFMIVHIDYWYNDEISFYWIQLPNIWSFITWNTWNICTPELLYDIQALKEWFVFYVEIKQYKLVFLRNTKITRLFQSKEFSLKIFTRWMEIYEQFDIQNYVFEQNKREISMSTFWHYLVEHYNPKKYILNKWNWKQ